VNSLNPRYTWVLYYGAPESYYVFNLVLGVQRPEPTPKPRDPTPAGVPFNLASTK
jgi:hypothetical protein